MNDIPVYYIDDDGYEDEDFESEEEGYEEEEESWDTLRLFIPVTFDDDNSDKYFIYTYADGTFEVQDNSNMYSNLISYDTNKLPSTMWKDFLKCIFDNDDVTRRS